MLKFLFIYGLLSLQIHAAEIPVVGGVSDQDSQCKFHHDPEMVPSGLYLPPEDIDFINSGAPFDAKTCFELMATALAEYNLLNPPALKPKKDVPLEVTYHSRDLKQVVTCQLIPHFEGPQKWSSEIETLSESFIKNFRLIRTLMGPEAENLVEISCPMM